MVWNSAFSCISACILLVQSTSLIHAAPLEDSNSLVKRGSSLHGKFLHITDVHLDPYYRVGADPDSYCHKHGKKRSDKSGKYGALGTDCDSPKALVDATFSFLKEEVKNVDFILYTGDTVRHDRDDDLPRTDTQVLDGHKSVIKYIQKSYTKSTPFVPTIGNNDSFDHNDVKKKDSIFSKLKTIWKPLKLKLDSNFLNGGYFVQEIIKGKLSVINLNTMYFYKKNDEVDDCDESSSAAAIQMKWLEAQLKTFAKKKGKHQAYIMGHVPPIDDDGSQLYKDACHEKYFNLLGKYGKYISGHFTGHTNDDNLNVVVPDGDGSYEFIAADDEDASDREDDLKKASVALFNAPSIIPVNNPAIRVYHYETSTSGDSPIGTITDWDQYYVDLDVANDKGKVQYELEYSASDLYSVDYFYGKNLAEAVKNVAGDKKARKLYKKYAKVSS
ncbi:MAG: Metallo-dependent phosphatase-like protein [Benjaminiella poitrasii]|nr:MAG: Metallo-dependent phosphatase-like protein [Benjaminiella poitrasii]